MIQKLEQYVIGINYGCGGASFSEVIDKVNEVIDFINSLPEEKPSEDLEEAAEESLERQDVAELFCGSYDADQMLEMFKAGSEWQKQQDNNFERFKDYTDKALISLEEAREQGRQEMKEQMMKDAVEGEIVKDITNKLAVTAKNINLDGFKFGDKARIIIVKED